MYYLDITTNKIKELTTENKELFDDLIAAIGREDYEDVGYILEDYPILAHAFDETGRTALKYAAGHHNAAGLEIVRILMSYGADPYAEDEDGFTSIHNVNRITDQALKAEFCDAMVISADTDAILRSIRHAKAVAEVEAEYAAKAVAEESAKNSAYERATTFDEKVAIDPLRAMREHCDDPEVKEMHKTIDKMIGKPSVYVCTETTTGEEAQEALESLYSKPEKASQLEFSVDEGISEIISSVFGTKKADVDMDTKQSILTSLADWLGVDLSQLAYLASLASGSGFLPFYHGGGSGDDDFGNGPFGNSGGILYDNNPLQANNIQVLGVMYNGTTILLEVADQ